MKALEIEQIKKNIKFCKNKEMEVKSKKFQFNIFLYRLR